MRRKRPESAPRLYEWLTEQGYVEPVSSVRSKRAKRGSVARARLKRGSKTSRQRRR